MKRNHLLIALLITAAMFISLGCATSQNSNGNLNMAAAATPQPTPDKAAIEAELTKIENDWPRILKERDAAAVRRIEADDIVLVYPDGSLGSKEQDVKDIESGSITADSWVVSDLTVNVLDNDSAVVRLRTTVNSGVYKTADGKSQDVSGQFRSVDTFARRNGQWQLVSSATVKILAPPPAPANPTPRPSPSAKPSPVVKTSPVAQPSPAMRRAAKPSPPKTIATPIKTKTP